MIVNRNDYRIHGSHGIGVGHQLMTNGAYDRAEIEKVVQLLAILQNQRERQIMAYDLGANIGCHSLAYARGLGDTVQVCAVEAQKRVFMMLCANIVLNDHSMIDPFNLAVGGQEGTLTFLAPDYSKPGSYGSLSLRQSGKIEDIGQPLAQANEVSVPMTTLDKLYNRPPDFIKIDIEGMEEEVLGASKEYLDAHGPVLFCEHIKSSMDGLRSLLEALNYRIIPFGMNLIAIRQDDPISDRVRTEG